MKLSRSPEAIEVYRRELKKIAHPRYKENVEERVDRMTDEEVTLEMERIMESLIMSMSRLVRDIGKAVAAMAPHFARAAAAIEASTKKREEG